MLQLLGSLSAPIEKYLDLIIFYLNMLNVSDLFIKVLDVFRDCFMEWFDSNS